MSSLSSVLAVTEEPAYDADACDRQSFQRSACRVLWCGIWRASFWNLALPLPESRLFSYVLRGGKAVTERGGGAEAPVCGDFIELFVLAGRP